MLDDQKKVARIYRAYRENFVNDLKEFGKNFRRRAFEYLREERGHSAIRPIYLRIISMIPAEGIRLSQLASLLDMNVQHCMDLLNEFEHAGYVHRTDDPLDSRARLVHLTKRGKALVYDSIDFGRTQDPIYQNLLTPAEFAEFERISGELNDRMGFSGMRSRQYPEYLDKTGSQLYGHLFQCEAYALRFIHRYLEASGHVDLKDNISWLVGQLGGGDVNIAGIAKLRDISVQAMGRIVKETEAAGYAVSLPDPTDRRRKTLLLTERGVELLADTVDAVNQLDKEFAGVIGRRKFDLVKRDLAVFCQRDADPAAAPSQPQSILLYKPEQQRSVRLDDAPLSRLQLLTYVAYLLDNGDKSQPRLTQPIASSVHQENLLMLTPEALDALNRTQLPLDSIEEKLQRQFGKKASTALARLIDTLKPAL